MRERKKCDINLWTVWKITTAVLLLELLVLNFRHWESLFNREITEYQTIVGDGLSAQPDGSFLAKEGEKTITFAEINQKLCTLYFDVEVVGSEERPVTLYQGARDESNELEYWLPDREVWHSQKKSQYLTYHLYGKCKSLRLTLSLNEGDSVKLHYALNPRIPLFFSPGRVLVLWCLCVFVYFFRPSSAVYRVGFFESVRVRRIAILIFLAVHILGAYRLVKINPFFQEESYEWTRQYQKLAEAFSEGQLSLPDEPSQALMEMENPYDRFYRQQVMDETGQGFLWDHAYYQGKYYVYFGVVPEILLYLPFYLLTGIHLHNTQAIFLGAVLFLIALMGIICRILKRWFPGTSFGVWYLLSETFVFSCGLIYMCRRPDIYTVPIIWGLALGSMGLWCFLCAEKEDRSISLPLLAAGSLCTALVAGCRPQLFLIVLFPLVLFRKYIFSLRYLRSKEGKRSCAAVLLPMALVAAGLMYYNYARFGSVFDFGANYNLTMNDMRNRGFVADRIPLGIWAYFLAPLQLKLTFPFAAANSFDTNYLGTTIFESTYGGIFAVSLFAWLGPLLLLFRKKAGSRTLLRMALAGMGAAVVIAIVDTQGAGILMRYMGDILFFVMFAAMLSFLMLFEKAKGGILERPMLVFLVAGLLVAVLYQGVIFFVDTGESLMDLRKDLFAAVKYQVMFWL